MSVLIKPGLLPPPDTLIIYPDGFVGPLMFHYASEDQDLSVIARDNGFQIQGYTFEEDEGHPLQEIYNQVCEGKREIKDFYDAWQPEVPEGWQFGGKHDTEDGPYCYFIRRSETVAA